MQTALLAGGGAGDVLMPTAPLGAMHGDAAGAALRARGATVRVGARVVALEDDAAVLEDGERVEAEAFVVAVRPRECAQLLDEADPGLEDSPIVSVHLLFDRQILRTEMAALLSSPAHWVFDRGALTGHRPERGQYLTVVASGVPELLDVRGKEIVELMAGELDRPARRRGAPLVARLARAVRDDRLPPRPGGAAAGAGDGARQRRARRDLDCHRLACDDGERGAKRLRSGAGPRAGPSGGRRVTTLAPKSAVSTPLDRAVEAATLRVLELQHPAGYWVGELESNATMIAEHLFLLHFLGLRDPATDRKLANELLARRREDGTWSNWWDGPADLSTTIESYVALTMAGVDAGEQTRAWIRSQGGIPASRVFTKCFLALLGEWPWQSIPPVPVEIVLLPGSAPFSIYNFACWARQTVVALSVVMALRPERRSGVDLRDIGARPGRSRRPGRPGALRRRAIAQAERWVRERQEADGCWGGIQPPWVWGLIMLAALGHGFEDPALARGLAGWDGFLIDEGDRLRPEACQSPVWDTGLALLALREAGLPDDHPAVEARATGCSPRRSLSAATGRCAGRTSRPAAGRSSSRTTGTRTSTTRRSSHSPCAAFRARTPRSRAAWPGRPACSRETAAGAPSTRTTRATGSTRSRSSTSAA